MDQLDISPIITDAVNRMYDLESLSSVGYKEYRLGRIEDYVASGSAAVAPVLAWVQIIGAVSTILFALGIAIVLMKMRALNAPAPVIEPEAAPSSQDLPSVPGGWMTARWEEVMRHMDSAKEAEWKFAIIEADKLVDEVLKRAGYPGDTLGERLANIQPGQLETLENLWMAHKIRNRVAHAMDYFLRYTEAKHAIAAYASTLKELGAL